MRGGTRKGTKLKVSSSDKNVEAKLTPFMMTALATAMGPVEGVEQALLD